MIRIIVNGIETATPARTLQDLVTESGYGEVRVATALNGRFIAASDRGTTLLEADDRIEIVAPRQGG